MKKIGFFPNPDKDKELIVANKLVDFVTKLGHEAIIPDGFSGMAGGHDIHFSDISCQIMDFMVVLGGDGTVLRAAQYAAECKIPLLGINMGNIGYLTDVEADEAEEAISQVLAGDFITENRMMLEVSFDARGASHRFLALNDFAVTRGNNPRLITCEISINGEFLDTLKGDGLIIATPTGSTAYSLAAGGPVLKPDANMIAITPICAYSLVLRPSVVDSGDSIQISFSNDSRFTTAIDGAVIDSAFDEKMSTITIKKATNNIQIIKTHSHSFYQILRMKMKQ